jgi:hypothetical protein
MAKRKDELADWSRETLGKPGAGEAELLAEVRETVAAGDIAKALRSAYNLGFLVGSRHTFHEFLPQLIKGTELEVARESGVKSKAAARRKFILDCYNHMPPQAKARGKMAIYHHVHAASKQDKTVGEISERLIRKVLSPGLSGKS